MTASAATKEQLEAALIYCLKFGMRADPFGTYCVITTVGHHQPVRPPREIREILDTVRERAL